MSAFDYRFTNPLYNGKITKWVKILFALYIMPNGLTRGEIVSMVWNVDLKKKNRSWQSSPFAELVKYGYIYYDRKANLWFLTNKGQNKAVEMADKCRELEKIYNNN